MILHDKMIRIQEGEYKEAMKYGATQLFLWHKCTFQTQQKCKQIHRIHGISL